MQLMRSLYKSRNLSCNPCVIHDIIHGIHDMLNNIHIVFHDINGTIYDIPMYFMISLMYTFLYSHLINRK